MAITAGSTLGRRAFLLGGIAPLATVGWALWHTGDVLDGEVVTSRLEWVDALNLRIDLRLDGFGLLMLSLVSGIGVLVFAYSLRYFSARAPGVGRLAGLLTLFAGSMLGLVLADNLLVLYVFWELTSLTSYLLIGNDDRDAEARDAAQHALMVTGIGGLIMLAGFVLLGQAAGTFQLSAIVAAPPTGGAVEAALVLILVGAFTKSAQFPFHGWLPSAMVAATPISAYLHSAAMVKAGVYLVARLGPAFATTGVWRPLVVAVGLATMILGGLRAFRAFDLKQLLALGTVSQLGFMMVLVGFGQPVATEAGATLLVAHGAFKAALFMVVGIVDHQTHTRDIRELPLLGQGWQPTKLVAVVSAASMAGLPPLAGFLAKEEAYAAFAEGAGFDRLVLAGVVAGSVLTVAYSLRLLVALYRPSSLLPSFRSPAVAHGHAHGVAGGGVDPSEAATAQPAVVAAEPGHVPAEPGEVPAEPKPPVPLFLFPAGLLAALTVVLGVATGVFSELVEAGASALDAAAHAELALWDGVTTPLALSVVTIAAGVLMFVARRPVAAVQSTFTPSLSVQGGYEASIRWLNRLATGLTGLVQPGSLPLYISVILFVAAVGPGSGLLLGTWWPGWPELLGEAAYIPVVGLLVGGALAAALATRRFAAALLLGSVGYGMALLFVVQGAPDLALTQFAIETLAVVLFLLVLRRLPDRFERPRHAGRGLLRARRPLQLAVAATVGAFVFVLAIAATGARSEAPVSDEIVELSEPEGGGGNVVNIILVDFRGFDTMGEITVLVVAAVGATAIARAGRRPRAAVGERPNDGDGPEVTAARPAGAADEAARTGAPDGDAGGQGDRR